MFKCFINNAESTSVEELNSAARARTCAKFSRAMRGALWWIFHDINHLRYCCVTCELRIGVIIDLQNQKKVNVSLFKYRMIIKLSMIILLKFVFILHKLYTITTAAVCTS